MTRINLGIKPSELCDQMLVAEYRELPRMCEFANKRLERYAAWTGPRPHRFKLNTGHMSFFIPYGATLLERWTCICLEMKSRGISANLTWRGYPACWMKTVPSSEYPAARRALITRIKERLRAMKRKPVWTNAKQPRWAA